jgi:hypothetical protein
MSVEKLPYFGARQKGKCQTELEGSLTKPLKCPSKIFDTNFRNRLISAA